MTIYTGDLLIKELEDGTWDIEFSNGQPVMTNGLETCSIMAVFGEDWWGNDIVRSESEKMKSTFPEVIRRNVVTDKTKNDGTNAIKKALKFFTDDNIAKSVEVEGEIFSTYGIRWLTIIEAITDETIKFFLNWEHGILTASFVS